MSRWKPPQPRSSPYITPEGYRLLQDELEQLWTRRVEVTEALSAAAAEGDRSENAEYIYRKKQLGEIDRRIRYLQKRLPELNVVREVGDSNRVFFGARVVLEDEQGKETGYRIVGGDEIDSDAGKGLVSVDSPMARAMLKKEVGDEVVLKTGDQTRVFYINAISYTAPTHETGPD